jgi:hypothetical protein
MNPVEAEEVLLEAARRVEELELRWQDQRAQRQRASELFRLSARLDLTELDDDLEPA